MGNLQLNQRLSSPCLSGHFTTACHDRDLAQERAFFSCASHAGCDRIFVILLLWKTGALSTSFAIGF